jgi:glycosyltransferase involved in cell wall biosynthesis
MKIIIVNANYFPNVYGGAELSVQHLAEGITGLGHDVVVVALGSGEQTSIINGVKVRYVPLANIFLPSGSRPPLPARLLWNLIDIRNPIMAARVSRIITEECPDIVHTNVLQGFSVSVWPEIKRRGIPLVHTLRDHLLLCPRSTMFKNGVNCRSQCLSCKLFSLGRRTAGQQVDAVVGISRYILDRHLSYGWFPRARATVIHNSFSSSCAASSRAPDGTVRFGFIGRLAPGKGIEVLIRSFERVKAPYARLIIGGTGHGDYIRYLTKLGSDNRIKFLGYIDRDSFYTQVDTVIVPSLHNEALGRAILEAYAYGKPVVASIRGGMPEIIEEGSTGFLFDPMDECRLTRILDLLSQNPEDLWQMAETCYRKAAEFGERLIAQTYLNVYAELVSCRSNVAARLEVAD